jgi:large subunit ribosomal protein L19e
MKAKKRLAARILKTSPKKIKFVADALEDIKKAITRADLRGLIAIKKVVKSKSNEQSRVRARKIATQKKKGRQKGKGSKKGSKYSVISRKETWMAKVRVQRKLLKELKERKLVSTKNYQMLYRKVKGGYFRNRRHIKLYLTEYHLIEEKKQDGN